MSEWGWGGGFKGWGDLVAVLDCGDDGADALLQHTCMRIQEARLRRHPWGHGGGGFGGGAFGGSGRVTTRSLVAVLKCSPVAIPMHDSC